MTPDAYRYDVYLSYSPEDESWAEQNLIPRLRAAGIKYCTPRDMPLGRAILNNIEDAVAQSRKVLLVLTPRWIASTWNQFEAYLIGSADPAGMLGRTLPVVAEPCNVPQRIRNLTSADLTDGLKSEDEFQRILNGLRPMTIQKAARHVFISYKRATKHDAKLASQIHRQLKDAGHNVLIDRDLKVGQDWAKQLEQMIEASDFVIVLLSEQAILSEMMIKEVEHAYWCNQHTGKAKLLPVRVNYTGVLPHPLSTYLDKIQYVEWRSRTPDNTVRLIAQLRDAIGFDEELPETPPVSVSPTLSPSAEQDEHLAPSTKERRFAETQPSEARLNVALARQLLVEYFSADELHTLCFDLGIDYENFPGQGKEAKARELVAYVERRSLTTRLVDACRVLRPAVAWDSVQNPTRLEDNTGVPIPVAPLPYADPAFIASLPDGTGALSALEQLYIEREADRQMRRALTRSRGVTITIRAPRQTGKSSLLIRGMKFAESQGCKPVFFDLQIIEDSYLQDTETFLRYITMGIASNLGIDMGLVDTAWSERLPPADKMTRFMERTVLSGLDGRIVLAIDEGDRLLGAPIRDTVFALLKAWNNARAINPTWTKIDFIVVISTEPVLLFRDEDQFPFHVGLKIQLDDFDREQVVTLNERYRWPLDIDRIDELMNLLGGHPFLTSKALYTMIADEMIWERLKKVALLDRGPFGDHLKRYLWLLRNKPELLAALKQFAASQITPDDNALHQLRQAGLLKGEGPQDCAFRCDLYEQYFRSKL